MKIRHTTMLVRVIDVDRRPVQTANVSCQRAQGRHIGAGRYRLSGVPLGRAVLTVEDKTFGTRSLEIEVVRDYRIDVVLGEATLPVMRRGGQEIPFRSPEDRLGVVTRGVKGAQTLDAWAKKHKVRLERPYGRDFAIVYLTAGKPEISPAELAALDGVRHVGPMVNPNENGTAMLTRQLVVHVQPDTGRDQVERVAKSAGCEVKRQLSLPDLWVLEVNDTSDVFAVLTASRALERSKIVITAEPNLAAAGNADTITPDDELYDEQWHFERVGMPTAWQHLRDANPVGVLPGDAADLTYGSADIVIGVMDTGVKTDTVGGVTTPSHPEFQGNVTSGDPKSVMFFDFGNMVANNDDPNASFGDGYHGSGCAGVILARADNASGVAGEEEGVAGVAPNCRMISAMGSNGQTEVELSDIYLWLAGLNPASTDPDFPAALATPASVITNSFGGHLPNVWPISVLMDQTLRTVTDNGRGGLGTLMFFSVGNGYSDDFWTMRPYASHVRSMGIGSVTDGDVKSGYSNWGDGIDLCTPSSGGTKGIMSTTIPGDGNTAGHTGGDFDYTSSFGGTSASTPLAAGVAALVLSMDPTLTWEEVRTILTRTAERIDTGNTDPDGQWRDDDGDGVEEYSWWYGFGMVDAARAVCVARNTIEVEPAVAFVDVPEEETAIRPVTIRVHGWRPWTFEVSAGPTTVSGPADSFLLHAGDSLAWEGSFECQEESLHIWLKYSGTTDGDTATGEITIRCVETDEEFPVVLSANTIARPKTALVIALDRSGSMDDPAGDGRLKIQLIRDGAAVVPVLADSGTGLGAVRWDTDADLAGAMEVEDAGEEVIGLGRTQLTTFISNHATNIYSATAIGDAVEAAQSLLDDATGYDEKAMVVLTDGNETASKYISELSAGDLHGQIFAIGVGTPENLNPGALDTLTGLHGGYMVLTGETTIDDQFLLTKYFQQILAGVTNTEIVVDPQGLLTPSAPVTHHFPVNETDREIDVIVHTWFPSLIRFTLETPNGKIIAPGDTGGFDSRYVVGHGSMYYRLKLPSSLVGPQDPSQPWVARLKLDLKGWYRLMEQMKKADKEEGNALARTLVHGLRYAFTTQARSSIRMDVEVTQSSREPGAEAWIRVKLSEYGYPLEPNAKVVCELLAPDGGKSGLDLEAVGDGVYQGSFQALVTGAWRVTIRAEGTTTAGSPFQREAIRTVSVWPDGDQPAPVKPKEDTIERFLRCICERGVIDPEIAKKYGVDMKRLCECLSKCSCDQSSTRKLTSREIAKVSEAVAEVLRRSM